MKKKVEIKEISLEHLSKEDNVHTGIPNVSVSKMSSLVNEFQFDFSYPQLINDIVMGICTKGKGVVNINLKEYNISKNTLVILPPNSVVEVIEGLNSLYVEFSFFKIDFISHLQLLKDIELMSTLVQDRACIDIEEEDFEFFKSLFRIVGIQYDNKSQYQKEIIKNLVYVMIYKAIELLNVIKHQNDEGLTNRFNQIFKSFYFLLLKNFSTHRTVNFYAKELHLSPKYFSKSILLASGKLPSDWIDNMVIINSKALIKGTTLSISQIADRLHFPNASFFGTYFKKRVGMSPLDYRNSE